MTTVSWTSTTSGSWNAPANWSTGVVPGPSNDVVITTSSPLTVTYGSGSDTILSLYMNQGTLAETGGSLTVLGNAQLYGGFTQSGGSFTLAGAADFINGVVNQTAGTIDVAAGRLTLNGTGNSFAGTLTGAAVDFASGSDTLAAGLSLNLGVVQIAGASVTLGQSFTVSGTWIQTAGTLALGGNTLTESGSANLAGGVVNGAGTIAISGGAQISGIALEGSTALVNTGSITQTGYWYLGYNSTDTSRLVNQAGATFTLAAASVIYSVTGSSFVNAGTLIKQAGGDSVIEASTNSTGKITVSSGTLTFEGGANTFSGTIGGAGTLELYAGTDKFNAGLSLTVGTILLDGSNPSLTLGGNLAYGGVWIQTAGTLALGGNTLTESGTTDLNGGAVNGAGTIAVTSTAEISGIALEGSAALVNTGSITQTGYWYLGYNSTDTSRLVNQAGATFTIAAASDIYSVVGARFTNAGTLIKQGGGDSVIETSTNSGGTITVASGTLTFEGATNTFSGTIGGPGALELYAGTDKFAAGLTLTVGTVLLDGSGPSLTLGGSFAYAGNWVQTAGTLALAGNTLTESGTTDLDGGVVNGAGTIAVSGIGQISGLALEGSAVLLNTGNITDTGYWYLGYNSTDTSRLLNQAGATFTLAGASNIYSVVGARLVNSGTLVKQGSGSSTIAASTTSSGTITVASGTLTFDGATNTFSGIIGGPGTLNLSAGTDKFNKLKLAVGNVALSGANVTLGASLAYAGIWTQTSGTLALGGKTLTASGVANLDGGVVNGAGTLAITKAGEISSLFLEGSAVLKNTGSITQTGNWYIGLNSGDTSQLSNQAGATFTIANNTDMLGVVGAQLNNAGTLIKNGGGLSSVEVAAINSGVVEVGSGTMEFLGAVSGTGQFQVGAGATLQFAAAVAAGSTVSLGAFADLYVQATAGFAATISGFSAGNFVELSGLNYSGASLSFNATSDQLTVTNGSASTMLQLTGSYSASDFRLLSDNGVAAIGHT